MAATASYACTRNCTDAGYHPSCDALEGTDEWLPWHQILGYFSYNPWVFSLLGSTMVGLSGIFPLWVIPNQDDVDLKTGEIGSTLKIFLSFAVGALLGDVFLHLLPEAFESEFQTRAGDNHASTPAGLWVLSAFLFFVIVEKLIAAVNVEAPIIETSIKDVNSNLLVDGAKYCLTKHAKTNGFTTTMSRVDPSYVYSLSNIVNRLTAWAKKFTTRKFFDSKTFPGYLNLLMNSLDNFTHGLSVGGSFLISFRVGVLSTFTILIHEIPHEVGDFAILLRSGFSRWDAAQAQLITATGGILGALAAVSFSGGLEERTNWILPLTAGGFIHIGLVTILPDLLKETNTKESLKQLGALLFGVFIMAALMFI